MGQHMVEEGRKSCRCECYYEKSLTGKERVRDLNSVKTEGKEVMKTRQIASSSSVIYMKCCNQPPLTLIAV